ncbi:protein kinase domain-containing protein [Nocardiopsis ganjiahuensis]|uniref:protein kinase domain-containing protein n=1 Tax=Nocardiopsis ganjiahuensis TaxID=239984 RepID=UPI0003489E3F|nr:protein kinase [Nocardiopsis ganjiahuensis]
MSLNLYVGPDSQPDKYRLVRSVGRGGEATLYLAEVSLAGQTEPVVVKVLNSDVTSTDEQFAELSAKWGEQAELLRFINRIGVVGVREHFEGAPEHPAGGTAEGDDRALYLVMNYVEGLDLRDWRAENVVEGPRGQREVLRYLEQVAQVLDMLHSGRATPSKRVVVHGDLSPGNVMISDEGQATLVDFGLSRIAARHMTARPWFTPGYAAPEIFNGEYSPATDRYAFGAIAYFALTGEDPPPAPEQLRERLGALPLVAQAGEAQRELVMSMFSAEPSERPESSDWVRALRSLATSVPWTGPSSEPVGPEPSGPDDALAAAAAMSPAPPQGERFSGPPPVGEPAPESAPEPEGPEPEIPEPAPEPENPVEEMSKRPVGGMRGAPTVQPPAPEEPPRPAPQPSNTQPPNTPPRNTPPRGGPVPGRPPAGPPPNRLAGPPPNAYSGPPPGGPPLSAPMPGAPMPGAPMPGAPMPGGPVPGAPMHSGPVPGARHATGAFTASQAAPPPTTVSTGAPQRKSRKPLVAGLALFAVVFMILGAAGTYVVMDRVVPALTGSDDGVELADAGASPEPSPTPAPVEATEGEGPTESDASADPSENSEDGLGPGERLLTEMEPVDTGDGIWEPERAEINGEVYNRVLLAADGDCRTCSAKWAEYDLSRSWDTFTATLGLDDNSKSGESVTFTVRTDGESASTETLTLGETVDIEVNVTDVLRLRLEIETEGGGDIYPVWADPTLSGD